MRRKVSRETHELLEAIHATKSCLIRQMEAVKAGKEPKKYGAVQDDLPDYEQLMYTYNTLQWLTRMIASGQIERND